MFCGTSSSYLINLGAVFEVFLRRNNILYARMTLGDLLMADNDGDDDDDGDDDGGGGGDDDVIFHRGTRE